MAGPAAVFDIIVVGGGVVGASTAVAAAEAGASVLLLEQFDDEGHCHGSSHGDGRIFRVAYEEEDYVLMAQAALDGWRALERAVGQELLVTTGGITTASREEVVSLDELQATFRRFGLPHERLGPQEVAHRFPQFRLAEGEEAVFQPQAGVLRATRCVRALWERARALGVTCLTGRRMTRLLTTTKDAEQQPPWPERARVAVVACSSSRGGDSGGEQQQQQQEKWSGCSVEGSREWHYYGRSAVLALGGWAAKELPGLPLTVTQEVVGFFPPKPAAAGSSTVLVDHSLSGGRMPVFICRTRHGIPPQHEAARAALPEDQGFYGLPQVEVGGVKVAAHHVGPVLQEGPHSKGGWPSEREAEQARSRHQQCLSAASGLVSRLLPQLQPQPCASLTCLYTSTPDQDFILGPHPDKPHVYVGAGFSGHGFKFGPALGTALSCLALGRDPPFPIQRFHPSRFILQPPPPPQQQQQQQQQQQTGRYR